MQSLVFLEPRKLQIEEREIPALGEDEALVRVKAAGICGTDIDCFLGLSLEPVYPYVPGHEWSGEVTAVGKAVTTVKVGERVLAECGEGCGVCDSCRLGLNPSFCGNPIAYGFTSRAPGAFADFIVRKERSLIRIPDNMSDEEAAVAEPLSVVYHGIWRIAGGVETIDDVAIFGAGPIGLLALMVVKASGARTFSIEPIKLRRDLARLYGADEVIDPTAEDPTEAILRLTRGRGVNLAIEASGSDDANGRLTDVAGNTGRILLIGQTAGRKIPLEIGRAIFKGLTIRGTTGNPFMFPPTFEFMLRNKIDFGPLITHKFPLDQAERAFALACKRTESGKILLIPGEGESLGAKSGA